MTNSNNVIQILDTTLREGEQSPGASLQTLEKLKIAHQLVRLGVDVIEAGFPASSPGEFNAVQRIAREVHGPTITAVARAVKADIDAVWNAIKDAQNVTVQVNNQAERDLRLDKVQQKIAGTFRITQNGKEDRHEAINVQYLQSRTSSSPRF